MSSLDERSVVRSFSSEFENTTSPFSSHLSIEVSIPVPVSMLSGHRGSSGTVAPPHRNRKSDFRIAGLRISSFPDRRFQRIGIFRCPEENGIPVQMTPVPVHG